jgi:beta-lactamase class A
MSATLIDRPAVRRIGADGRGRAGADLSTDQRLVEPAVGHANEAARRPLCLRSCLTADEDLYMKMNRRAFLGTAGATLAGAWARPTNAATPPSALDALARLEQRIGGRVGVCALDSGTGACIEHRADERFAMCSTFKWALAAAVLSRVDRSALALEQPMPYGERDLLSYAPVTREHVAEGRMTIGALARAAVVVSDNTAANLLLAQIGGPPGFTRFFRELGDDVTRLDRNEPTLNANQAGDVRDTTSPRAMAQTMRSVLTGTVLSQAGRERLIGWLVDCQTGLSRLRAGLPASWRAGDKTGAGGNGACNDVAIAWPPKAAPWLIASYLSESSARPADLNAAHAEIGRIVAMRATSVAP